MVEYELFAYKDADKILRQKDLLRALASQQLKVVVFDLSDEYTSLMIARAKSDEY